MTRWEFPLLTLPFTTLKTTATFSVCGILAMLLFRGPEAEAITKVNLRGAGASFPAEVYQAWTSSYRASRQAWVELNVTYEPVGSGAGKNRILDQPDTIEYAGSDDLFKEADLKGETDLVFFPSMAGSVVLTYNIPMCSSSSSLNLSREHLVGIFNGTLRYWNDSDLMADNPDCSLPSYPILVIVRSDRSGTTSIFTEALASFSAEWSHTFGIFSDGIDEVTREPLRWNRSGNFMFGRGNMGMAGIAQSLPYSLAYMTLSAAGMASLPVARVQNKQGRFQLPTVASVQAAMDSRPNDLYSGLADSELDGAYPIAGYTYLGLFRTKMANCDSAKELVRYANWFSTSKEAQTSCVNNKMVPLSQRIQSRVRDDVLKIVTCQGQNVWQAMLQDMEQEGRQQEAWVVPVAVSVPLVSLLVLGLLSYILWQRYRLYRMLDRDDWHVPIEQILFYHDGHRQGHSSGRSRLSGLSGMTSLRSYVSLSQVPNGEQVMFQILQWPGRWKNFVVGVRLMEVSELRQVTRDLKVAMLGLRDSALHANVVRFFGLTELEGERYVVSEYCAKGPMVEILRNNRYNLNNDFKYCLALDVAAGMAFLHDNALVHGALTSSCCLIDARWTVKVGDWEYCRLLATLQPRKSPMRMLHHRDDEDRKSHAAAFRDFWVAPEVIRSEWMQMPTTAADVYSFGIILQEIFTREDPFAEHADTLTPHEVVRAVCNNHLRPQPHDDTPVRMRQLMEITWAENPAFRPSFDQILKMLRQSRTTRKTVMDSMMETMEEYTHHLEEQVGERSAESELAKRKLETFLLDTVPPHLVPTVVNGESSVTRLATGHSVQGQLYANLGVVLVEVTDVHATLLSGVRPKDLLVFLNDLCLGLDSIIKRYSGYRASLTGECQTILLGLGLETAFLDQRCACTVNLALDLLHFASQMAPLVTASSSSSATAATTLTLRAGVNVGRVVTGVVAVGAAAPRFVALGEGVEVGAVLVRSSEPGRVRASRYVVTHLHRDLDLVCEDAGWIFCKSLEVESYWIRPRASRKPQSAQSNPSIDTIVEPDEPTFDPGGGDIASSNQGDRDVITAKVERTHGPRSAGPGPATNAIGSVAVSGRKGDAPMLLDAGTSRIGEAGPSTTSRESRLGFQYLRHLPATTPGLSQPRQTYRQKRSELGNIREEDESNPSSVGDTRPRRDAAKQTSAAYVKLQRDEELVQNPALPNVRHPQGSERDHQDETRSPRQDFHYSLGLVQEDHLPYDLPSGHAGQSKSLPPAQFPPHQYFHIIPTLAMVDASQHHFHPSLVQSSLSIMDQNRHSYSTDISEMTPTTPFPVPLALYTVCERPDSFAQDTEHSLQPVFIPLGPHELVNNLTGTQRVGIPHRTELRTVTAPSTSFQRREGGEERQGTSRLPAQNNCQGHSMASTPLNQTAANFIPNTTEPYSHRYRRSDVASAARTPEAIFGYDELGVADGDDVDAYQAAGQLGDPDEAASDYRGTKDQCTSSDECLQKAPIATAKSVVGLPLGKASPPASKERGEIADTFSINEDFGPLPETRADAEACSGLSVSNASGSLITALCSPDPLTHKADSDDDQLWIDSCHSTHKSENYESLAQSNFGSGARAGSPKKTTEQADEKEAGATNKQASVVPAVIENEVALSAGEKSSHREGRAPNLDSVSSSVSATKEQATVVSNKDNKDVDNAIRTMAVLSIGGTVQQNSKSAHSGKQHNGTILELCENHCPHSSDSSMTSNPGLDTVVGHCSMSSQIPAHGNSQWNEGQTAVVQESDTIPHVHMVSKVTKIRDRYSALKRFHLQSGLSSAATDKSVSDSLHPSAPQALSFLSIHAAPGSSFVSPLYSNSLSSSPSSSLLNGFSSAKTCASIVSVDSSSYIQPVTDKVSPKSAKPNGFISRQPLELKTVQMEDDSHMPAVASHPLERDTHTADNRILSKKWSLSKGSSNRRKLQSSKVHPESAQKS